MFANISQTKQKLGTFTVISDPSGDSRKLATGKPLPTHTHPSISKPSGDTYTKKATASKANCILLQRKKSFFKQNIFSNGKRT